VILRRYVLADPLLVEWRAPASNHDSFAVLIVIVSTAALHTPLPRMGWTGRAPAPNGSQSPGGLEARGDIAMSRKTDAVVARTIGIDTGKNTLHLIGLYDKGAIVLREKLTRGRIAARLAIPIRHFGTDSDQALRHIRENLVVSRRN
jgi:hypothetical protein